jgi:hypothetical protein
MRLVQMKPIQGRVKEQKPLKTVPMGTNGRHPIDAPAEKEREAKKQLACC